MILPSKKPLNIVDIVREEMAKHETTISS